MSECCKLYAFFRTKPAIIIKGGGCVCFLSYHACHSASTLTATKNLKCHFKKPYKLRVTKLGVLSNIFIPLIENDTLPRTERLKTISVSAHGMCHNNSPHGRCAAVFTKKCTISWNSFSLDTLTALRHNK